MKKLMTMLAAAAVAFGLYADEEFQHQDTGFISGTSFESNDGGTSGDIDSAWWTKPAAGEIAILPGKHEKGMSNRPTEYLGLTDANVLNLKTTLGNPAELKSTLAAGGLPLSEGDIYFDGLVNMTVFDEVPGEYSDAKIAVYLLQTNEEDDVQFIVRAKNNDTVKDIAVADAAVTDGWHRLTIKVISEIGTKSASLGAGFVIFVDGTAVNSTADKLPAEGLNLIAQSYNKDGALFLPLAATTAIAGVEFDGQGSVDELVFTKNAPDFAKNPQVAELVFEPAKGANFMYSTVAEPTDGDWVAATASPLKFGDGEGAIAFPANGKVWLKWDASATYCAGAATQYDIVSGETTTVPGSDYVAAKASFNDVGYETLADAIAAATTAGTIKLVDACELTAANPIVISDNVTLDLAGKQLTLNGTLMALGTVTGAGKVITTAMGVLSAGVIESGTFDVIATATTTKGGKFLIAAPNEKPAYGGDGAFKFVEGTEADAGYWVLAPLATPTFSAEAGANSDRTKVMIGGEDVTGNVPATITEGQAYEVTYTAQTGYAFDGQATKVISGTAATDAVNADGPAATAILVTTITVTAAGDATEVDEGATLQLTAAVLPEDALLKDVTWSSSDDNLATVDATSGLVTGVKAGNVTITATAKDASGVTGKIDLEVKAAGPVDPADDDPALIPVNETAAHRYGDRVPEKLADVSAKDLCVWATGSGELESGDDIIAEAFLLDCANDEDAVAEAQKEFVFSSIEFKNGEWVVKMINDEKADGQPWKNGQIQVKRYSDVECKTTADDGNFFKATLEPINVPVVE